MATTLTLYKGIELNNRYQDVFNSQATLETYLSDKVSATITGDWYFKMTGEFNLPVSGYSDTPNYMKAVDTVSGNTSYYFIQNYEVYNAIYRIGYILDIWHTYLPVLKIKDGVRNMASNILGEYADIPYNIVTGVPHSYANNNYSTISAGANDTFMLLAAGFFWQGSRPAIGIPSKVTQFFTYASQAWSDDTLSTVTTGASERTSTLTNMYHVAINMVQKFSALDVAYMYGSNSGSHWYFEITDVWILRRSGLGNSSGSDQPFYNWRTTNTFLKGCSIGNSNTSESASDCNHVTCYSTNDETGTAYCFYLFTGMRASSFFDLFNYTTPIYNKTICEEIGLGNGSLRLPHRIYKSEHTIEEAASFGPGGLSTYVTDGLTSVDFASGLEVNINFDPQRAEVAAQKRNNWIISMIGAGVGMAGDAGTAATQATSGDIAGAAGSAISGLVGVGTTIFEGLRGDQTTIPARGGVGGGLNQIYYAFDGIYYDIVNYQELENEYRLYGLEVNYPASGEDFTDGDKYSYNVIGYKTVAVCGEMPEQYKSVYEDILTRGVRVWNDLAMDDNILHPLDTKTSVPDIIKF